MEIAEFIQLVRSYPEFENDLDETACPNGFVTCPICGGGAYIEDNSDIKRIPTHQKNCLRGKFEKEYKGIKLKGQK